MNYALRPRPQFPPDELAAVFAAAEALLNSRASPDDVATVSPWRFSGRWFAAGPYTTLRRPRL